MTETLDVVLAAVDERAAACFDEVAGEFARVRVWRGSILDAGCAAVVSPANSFGFMDGGLDGRYLVHFGQSIQTAVRARIFHDHDGELFVGEALAVETGDASVPWLIAAPTMRVPMRLPADTVNPYLAMRAILRCAAGLGVTSVAVPGLGTGVGGVPAATCARQMAAALRSASAPTRLPGSWAEASEEHQLLYTDRPGRLQY
ncbi:macro domain-containing protein [Phytomonospora endophytica]|uniref:O-acetyl-ADP-ribose deacetylase (Regulator of RNase III) n=1 Tax=Phytomonospora endophytica TaxID=714109 RepID=A0A841FZ98_9ACTN|nr:macro domain-containing protein [Phytomonospora endophytica]MBB6037769.1 O-acetyl-ADP-ribose deacetylase (regulator of RNase III) [Phytomonospora endophytica]GIG67701.1 tail protein [Phytomonospora endophytica]